MLEAAQRRRAEGVDVVVGYVELHGRAETERLLAGLEQLPPLMINFGDTHAPRIRSRCRAGAQAATAAGR